VDQSARGGGHVIDGAIERRFVGARWSIRAAQLPDELESRCSDFVIRGRRFEVRERLDISAHETILVAMNFP
jgi:hypothetical protein